MSSDVAGVPEDVELWVDLEESDDDRSQHAPARITGREGDEFVISAPQYADGTAAPQPGGELVLRWTDERGVHEVHAALLSVTAGDPPTWRVRALGPVERVQRREYARAPMIGSVAIVPVATNGPIAVVTGELADLSEGGLRAHLSGVPLPAGTSVEVHLQLESTPATLLGEVLRSDARDGSGTYETVVTFHVPESSAARLRRIVLHQQSIARRERPE